MHLGGYPHPKRTTKANNERERERTPKTTMIYSTRSAPLWVPSRQPMSKALQAKERAGFFNAWAQTRCNLTASLGTPTTSDKLGSYIKAFRLPSKPWLNTKTHLPGVLGEAPLVRLKDLLAPREFELGTPEGLHGGGPVVVLGPDGNDDLEQETKRREKHNTTETKARE